MTIPLSILQVMVYAALLVSACTPIALLVMLCRDWKQGRLW